MVNETNSKKQIVHHHHHHHHHHYYNRKEKKSSYEIKNTHFIIEDDPKKTVDEISKNIGTIFKIIVDENSKKMNAKSPDKDPDYYEYNYDKETTIYDCEISCIDDLIKIGMLYNNPDFKETNYSFNVRGINRMIPVLEELKLFIGMEDCKKKIIDQIIYFSQNLHQENKDIKSPELTSLFNRESKDYSKEYNSNDITIDNENDIMHTVIRGGPGVGKTMFAKILARIYLCLGISTKNTFKIIKRTDLIGEYLGHTAVKTQKAINEAMGGVLFIDEAYSLGSNSKNGDAYSKECIDVLTQNLSEHKGKFICIIAGYTEELEKHFFALNPGLRRRFSFYYDLKDYNYSELCDIFISKFKRMNKWKIDKTCEEWLLKEKFFEGKEKYFPFYGGDIDKLITKIKISHSHRIFGKEIYKHKCLNKADICEGFKIFKKEFEDINLNDENDKVNPSYLNMYI